MVEKTKPAMEYKYLGNSGLKVSVVAYGDMLSADTEENQTRTNEVIMKCFECGINFFDTAEAYGEEGAHEKLLGRALKASGKLRSEYVVSTKLFISDWTFTKPNRTGLSRKHLMEGVKNSLKRLQMDYVDVLFCHRPDSTTTMEEIVLAFKDIFEKNQALYWATSEWTASEIAHAYWMCEKYGVPKPIAEQSQYNMVHRDKIESDFAYLYDKHGMGTTIWGTLSGGLLTGKLVEETFDKSGTRYDNERLNATYKIDKYTKKENVESTKKMFADLGEIGKEFGITLAELAIAWALRNNNVTTAVLGLTKPSHVESALNSVAAYKKLTKEHEIKIDAILGNAPENGVDWKTFQPKAPRRHKFYC